MNRLPCFLLLLILAAGCNRADNQPQTDPDAPQPRAKVQARSSQSATTQFQPGDIAAVRVLHPKREADAIFTNATLLRIDIEIPRAGMSALRGSRWGNGVQRPVAKATVREGGVAYGNVAIHLKGSAGSFRSVDDKPAMTLSFDKFVPEQSFHGLHKISLNNSVQDPSFLCEKISRELFIAAGVPVPRAAHALVRLNGRDLGLFVVLEGANKQFLKHYFSNVSGNLYDGGFCRDIAPNLEVNCGENPKNNSGLKNLCAAVNRRSDFAQLSKVLDMDRFLSMVAMEMMLCHWDGYSLNRNNWRIFHDLESNRMVFIPHGLDQMFGLGGQFNPGNPIIPQNAQGKVTQVVLATEEGRARYRERFAQLYTNVFKADEIVSRVEAIAAGLRSALADSDPQLALSIQQRADSLKHRILRRADGLRRQLAPPARPLDFDNETFVRLPNWKPSPVRSGEPTLTQAQDPAGHTLLTINAGNALSSSSWRTQVVLRAGRYQFEGRLRLDGVAIEPGDARGGAGLRISKGTMPRKLTGTSQWTGYKYPFSVAQDGEVELICELRALKGEATFDAASLRLIRIP